MIIWSMNACILADICHDLYGEVTTWAKLKLWNSGLTNAVLNSCITHNWVVSETQCIKDEIFAYRAESARQNCGVLGIVTSIWWRAHFPRPASLEASRGESSMLSAATMQQNPAFVFWFWHPDGCWFRQSLQRRNTVCYCGSSYHVNDNRWGFGY